jgi:hypothetical protein
MYGSLKKRATVKFNWKGAAVQRGLEPGRRGIAIVRSRYQATTSQDTVGWRTLDVKL